MNDALPRNDIESQWMPFTANRQFKAAPRLIVSAQGMYYGSHDGRKILDGTAGLWCCNAGHAHPKIVEAVRAQVLRLDYAPAFQMGHPAAFEAAARLAGMLPGDLDRVFFTNSGSESVDTALKIAIAYHRVRGEAARTRLIGRERGYHGVGFGGMSVGGIANNRKLFGVMLPGVDHLPHTHNLEHNAFSRGQPRWGAQLADELERIVQLHDASTIAAVIVEPMAGSTGVLVPPVGYLERLRAICDRHGILLIFDEVITGFGRLGSSFAAEHFSVLPDMVTLAKGLTNATIPMGAVGGAHADLSGVHGRAAGSNRASSRLHLFGPSGGRRRGARRAGCLRNRRPVRARRRPRALFRGGGARAATAPPRDRHSQHRTGRGHRAEPRPGQPTRRAYETFVKCYERGVLIRTTGDTIALSPPLIIDKGEIDTLFGTLGEVLDTVN